MLYRVLFVRTPPCFYVLAIVIFLVLGLIWGIGSLRAMNMAQLPMSDAELHAHAKDVWNDSQLRLLEIDGHICTPPQSMFLPVVHATLNNQLIETTLETPYGSIDSSAFSPYSACFASPFPENDLALVRVVIHEVYSPFNVTLYEWTISDGSLALPPIPNPVTGGVMEYRTHDLWETPQPEDGFFDSPWFREETETTTEMVCFGINVKDILWLEVRFDGEIIEKVERYKQSAQENGKSDPSERVCFVMPYQLGLLQVTVQDSPTTYLIHQWSVNVVYRDSKRCLATSQSSAKC